jgi:CheY-like chemotaxis protein
MGNIEMTRSSGRSSIDPDKWFDDMSKAVERARDLSNQLLTFSKGGAPIRRAIALEGLLCDVIHERFNGIDVHFNVDVPPDLGEVNVDEGQMRQALAHVLRNAQESMPEGGAVDISVDRSFVDGENMFLPPGEYVRVRVKDSGIGIPASEANRVFEPYFTTKSNHAGMGLSIAYSIVNAHGGHISIESDVKDGTTVQIDIPSVKIEHHTHHTSECASPQKDHLNVLVMDDEEMIRDVASEMLGMMGHACDSVYGGREALEAYASAMASGRPYDLVVMDLTIPNGMGGKEAIVELLRIDPNAKVIVSSGYSNDPVMSDYLHYGFRSVMPKPYRMRDLELAIKQALTVTEHSNNDYIQGCSSYKRDLTSSKA